MPMLVCQQTSSTGRAGGSLLGFATARRVQECPLALLTAYLDESENATECGTVRVFAIGGYVAFPHHFDGLAPAWRKIVDERLRPLGLNRFHMSWFESKVKGFEKLTQTERHQLLRDLINIVHGCEIQPIAVALDMREWGALPDAKRKHYQTPFYPMMQAVIDIISSGVQTSDNDPRFQFIFDLRNDVVRECGIAYELMKHRLPQLADTPPAFMSNEHVPELQAADIVAYDTCKAFRNQLAGDNRIRYSTRMLQEKRELWFNQVSLQIR